MEQLSMFSSAKREAKLSVLGDNLEKLNETINWEMFRPMLVNAVTKEESKGAGGRPRFDVVMMFKVVLVFKIELLNLPIGSWVEGNGDLIPNLDG